MTEITPSMSDLKLGWIRFSTRPPVGVTAIEAAAEFERAMSAHDEQVRAAERERCVEAIRNVDPRPRIGRSIWEFVPRREAIDALMAVPAEQKESTD